MEAHNEFETELRQYPSYIDLYDEAKLMSKEYVQKVKRKLMEELDHDSYDTTMETVRAWNLISFLNFILGNETDAFMFNSKVLSQSKGKNIIGLCNKAWFLLQRQEQYNIVKDLCKQLKELIKDRNSLLISKAEKAFCYSRFGIKRYEKSREFFEEVLEEYDNDIENHRQARHNSLGTDDQNQLNIPPENFCVWNFGYALTFKRSLNLNNTHDASSIDLSKQAVMKVCELYDRIILMKGDSNCILRYKARSYVELGSLVYNVRKCRSRFPNGIKDILPNSQYLWIKTNEFYLKAISLCPTDVFVLERSGKHFRYTKGISRSKKLLEKAIEIRGTAFSHHHLALTLKRTLEMKGKYDTSTPSHTNFPVSKEKYNASRNMISEFEKVDNHFPLPRSEDLEHGLVKHTTSCEDDNSKKWIQRDFGAKKSYNIHHTSDSSHHKFKRDTHLFGSNQTGASALPAKTSAESNKHLSVDNDIEQVCSTLEHVSLDSGYESMQLSSSETVIDEIKDTRVKHKQASASTNCLYTNAALKRGDSCVSYDGTQCRYSRSGGTRRNYSSIKQNYSRPVTSKSLNNYREDEGLRSVTQVDRRPPRIGSKFTKQKVVDDKMTFVKMIKSPQKPPLINKETDKETIEKIILHLDKSVELSNNCGAIYDKGLLYRQTGEHDKALATFKTLIRNEGGYCSLIQLSNAFEQSGLCLYDILTNSEEDNRDKEDDMKMYFKRSIEISCSIVSRIPFLKDCWTSAPTLKDFLSGKARTSENLKDFVFLSKKLENYGEVISVLKELKELTVDEKEKTKIDAQLVDNYIKSGSYDDAVLALDAIACLQNGYDFIEERMYLRAHIDGGIAALKQEYFEMAGLRLRNALDFYRHAQNLCDADAENDIDIIEDTFDIFILCNEDIEGTVKTLDTILTSFMLRVTINLLALLPGASKMSGICRQFERSKHFLLVIDDKPLSKIVEHYFGMMQEVVIRRGYGHVVIIKTGCNVEIPLFISKYTNMVMDFETYESQKCYENDRVCKDVRTLLFKLASSDPETFIQD